MLDRRYNLNYVTFKQINKGENMEMNLAEININGKIYVEKDSITNTMPAKDLNGMEYCIVRTYSAGVFAGYINRKEKGKERTIYNSRRIWYWDGAASLSQLAVEGTSKPENCKFPCIELEKDLTEIIEIIPCTVRAESSIKGVKIWSK